MHRTKWVKRVQRGALGLYWFVLPSKSLIQNVEASSKMLRSPVEAFTWAGVDVVALMAMRKLLGAIATELSLSTNGMPLASPNVLMPVDRAQKLFSAACVFLQTPEDSEKRFGPVAWAMLRTVLLGFSNMLQAEKGLPASGQVAMLRPECSEFIPYALGHYRLVNQAIKQLVPDDIAPHERAKGDAPAVGGGLDA